MKLIYNGLFGSRLYGLETVNSDIDFRGVFIPTPRQLLIDGFSNVVSNNSKKDDHAKSDARDTDETYFSLNILSIFY